MGVVTVTWPKFKIWDPSVTFEWIKIIARNFVWIHYLKPFVGGWKLTTKGVWLTSRDQLWNFGTPFISSEWLKLETSYSVNTSSISCSSQRTTNWPPKIGVVRSRDISLKYATPSITFEWIRCELLILYSYTLHEAFCLLIKNSPPEGCGLGHMTHFEILGSAL